jgi:hypothetical protein
MVLSIEEHDFLVEYIFQEGNRYTDLVQEQFAEKLWPHHLPDFTSPDFYLWGAAKAAVYRDQPHMLNTLRTGIFSSIFITNH